MLVRRAAYPAWSPNGAQLAFHRISPVNQFGADTADGGLWVINADGPGAHQFAKGDGTQFSVADSHWSADGRWISFIRTHEGLAAEVVPAMGGRSVLRGQWIQWGPTGSLLAFGAFEQGKPSVRILPAPDRQPTAICCGDAHVVSLAFSPNGETLSAAVDDGNGFDGPAHNAEVWLRPQHGTPSKVFARMDDSWVYVSDLQWAPDGTTLALVTA